jgi:WD40 repeat protein
MMSASRHVLLVASTGQSQGHGDLLPRLTALDVVNGTRRTVALTSPPHVAAVVYLRVSPDRRMWFVTGADVNEVHNDQTATTWAIDARSRRVRWTAQGPPSAFASPVQVSPDGKLLAVGYSTGEADVLDAASGRLIVRDSSSSTVASGDLALAAGDKLLVTASLDGLLRTWSTRGSEQSRLQTPAGAAVDFTPDGRGLVLLGSKGEIVDRSGRVLRRFPGFPVGSVVNYCNSCFAASPGLRRVSYLDPLSATPRIDEIEGLTGRRVASVAVGRLEAQGVEPDGRLVASYVDSERLFAQVIDPRSGRTQSLQPGPSKPGCIATTPSFTPDGRIMAIVDGCDNVVVWDLRSGRVRRTIVLAEHATGAGVLSPDGRFVLVPVAGGAFARADLVSGAVAEVPGTKSPGNALAISPDGRYYAIGREDGTVDEYDARSLRVIRRHVLENAVTSLVFSPNGSELAVQDASQVLRVWDTCRVCQNPRRLAAMAAAASVRTLTPAERATFNVP